MSVKRGLAQSNGGAVAKRRFDRCFTFIELPVERGKSLRDQDSSKLKEEIKKWAKAVVAYARQVSTRIGSGRRGSSRKDDSKAD